MGKCAQEGAKGKWGGTGGISRVGIPRIGYGRCRGIKTQSTNTLVHSGN